MLSRKTRRIETNSVFYIVCKLISKFHRHTLLHRIENIFNQIINNRFCYVVGRLSTSLLMPFHYLVWGSFGHNICKFKLIRQVPHGHEHCVFLDFHSVQNPSHKTTSNGRGPQISEVKYLSNQIIKKIKRKMNSNGRRPPILKVKYLSNHWSNIHRILNFSLCDQTKL